MPVFPIKSEFTKLTSILLLALAVSLFTGCGGSGGSAGSGGDDDNNDNNEPQTFTVMFDSRDGSSVASQSIQQGGTVLKPANPTLSGHIFEGWYSDPDRTTEVPFPYTVNGNVTFYAKWKWLLGEQIYTSEELKEAINNDPGGRYKLERNISLEGGGWEPIGAEDNPFTGEFDGNGYKITGLKIGNTALAESVSLLSIEGEEKYAGFFRYVIGGEIKNLHLEDVDISEGAYVGAIVGYIKDGKITNSSSSGKITATTGMETIVEGEGGTYSSVFYSYAGGIAGYAENAEITDCSSEADVDASVTDTGMVGGIAGWVLGGTITNCYSTGDISASSASGGIAGYVNSGTTITNCYSMGDISSAASFSGGIAGWVSNSTITDCYSTGDISAAASSSGGIAGWVSNSAITDCYSTGDISAAYSGGGIAGYAWDSTITDCYSTGDISAYAPDSAYASDSSAYSGGIAGFVWGTTITNCYSTGDISSYVSDSAAYAYSGGIAGYVNSGTTIANCYSTGDISAYASDSAAYAHSGGIAGYVANSTITDCYSTGDISAARSGGIAGYIFNSTITDCYSTGDISAASSGGGIAGLVLDSTITDCAAINRTITAASDAGRIAGMVITGDNQKTISNNFALDIMTDPGAAKFITVNTMRQGVSKTDAQLRTQSTYSGAVSGDGAGGLGWGFGSDDDNPWKMPFGRGYPILYWQQE